jgi:predicted AlkP superfamily pyrophosphatase or phosphodiesterase
MIQRFFASLLFASLAIAPIQRAQASAYDAHPKLVVVIVIDQFRGDYLERYSADFKGRGFRLFLDKGAYFTDCYYDYANTKTAPGHATIGTGAYTDGHGIGSNEWWDTAREKNRPITSVEDDRYALIGLAAGAAQHAGASPLNLHASTIGDELRLATQGQSRLYGISLKDRAAILPAGATANGAFWIDAATGHFITSSYYMASLPDWAQTFNSSTRAQDAINEAGVENPQSFFESVGRTPAANSYELDFARALIQNEQLGAGPTTDLVTISLSPNDIMGHGMGPDSTAEKEMVDSLDTDLDSFFTWLDKTVPGGLANVWIALSADHGIAPVPATAAQLGLNAASINLGVLIEALNSAVNLKFSPGEHIKYFFARQELPYIVLNREAFDKAGINELEAEDEVKSALPDAFSTLAPSVVSVPDAAPPGSTSSTPYTEKRLPPIPSLYHAYTRLELESGKVPPTDFGRLLAHSYTPNGGWYVMTIPAAFQMEALSGSLTTHFSPYSYDRHVPLAFYGTPFIPGVYRERVAPVDLAVTLASLLGLNQPSAAVGHVLTDAIHPLPITTPPERAPRRPHRTAGASAHPSVPAQPKGATKP